MRTDLSPDTDVSLLPRADLPVIWDAFKAKAEAVRTTAETLTVTCITQKEEMALARTTRLALREIRIAVENKRVELGESHLKEIKKVNGAATAIKEFIQPLEARLLIQESFAEQHEILRIAELTKSRNAEVRTITTSGITFTDLGKMPQAQYDEYLATLRAERATIEEANRLRVEAERRLAEAQAEAQRVAEVTRATLELAQRVALEVKQKSDAEAERQRKETAAILNAKLEAQRKEAEALELKQRAEYKAQCAEYELKERAAREAAEVEQRDRAFKQAQLDAELAEQKRIRDEQFAVLEAELAQERAVKLAERIRLHKLSVAPDVEKLQAYVHSLLSVPIPSLENSEVNDALREVVDAVTKAALAAEFFSASKV